jgi:hypothetical protein
MTKRTKSQGPSHIVVGASALVFCAVLVGAAYWLRVEPQPAAAVTPTLAASRLQPLYERCDEDPSRDLLDGRPVIRCTCRAHPAFMMEVIEENGEIERASMLVPLRGTMNQLLDRMLVGLEMFGLVAGVSADRFLPKEYTDAIGTSETHLVYQGRVYQTRPVPSLGLVFLVTREGDDPAADN